jgi:hypothetical protein
VVIPSRQQEQPAEPKLSAGDPFSSYDLRRIYSTDATEIGVNRIT